MSPAPDAMSPPEELTTFVILGQEFRLRADEAGRKRIERAAETVSERIRAHKERGAVSDMRAVIMAACELAFELDELTAGLENDTKTREALSHAAVAVDRLLAKLSVELDDPQPDFLTGLTPVPPPASRRKRM